MLSIPSVQTKLGKKATNYLNNEFKVDINVNKVDLSFLGKVQLKEVFIKNHHTDTLVYIENLATSILSFKKLVDGKPEFGQISLDNFILNIRTYKGEVDDALTVFVDKFDDGTVSDKPSGFILTSTRLKLNKGYVEVVDDNFEDDEPVFFKEIKGLFGNIYPDNLEYKKFRNFYLFYLTIYLLLFIAYLVFNKNS